MGRTGSFLVLSGRIEGYMTHTRAATATDEDLRIADNWYSPGDHVELAHNAPEIWKVLCGGVKTLLCG